MEALSASSSMIKRDFVEIVSCLFLRVLSQLYNLFKTDAFFLDLSFIGWQFLSAFTCGILAIFYVNPYIQATHAEIYAFNKQKAFESGYIR